MTESTDELAINKIAWPKVLRIGIALLVFGIVMIAFDDASEINALNYMAFGLGLLGLILGGITTVLGGVRGVIELFSGI